MSFFKKHWISIIAFAVIWITGWKIICYIYPSIFLLQLAMPTVVVIILLIISKAIQNNWKKWPWQLKLSEWKVIIQDIKYSI